MFGGIRRARCWILLAVALLLGCSSEPAKSRPFPSKQITIICPWAAGGGTDRVARFWADALERELGKPVVVVNRTGGSGVTGHSAGAMAKPDGHTITIVTFELATMHHMGLTDLTYQDFTPLLQMNADPAAIIVREDAPWKDLKQLLDDAQKRPGEIKMSGTSAGGAWDLARAGLLQTAELPTDVIAWTHNDGAAPSLVELLGGHIDAVCCSVPEAASQIESGQLRALAVMADERLAEFPDIPTCRESGWNWTVVGWRGLATPKKTPPEVLTVLSTTCRTIAESEEYKNFMAKNQFGIAVRTGDDFNAFLAEQDARWKDVIEAAGYAKK